ncbi:MAG TPA: hypothetical protein V6D34_04065 [Candidatus Sericytochromatia bacterium]
MQTSLSDDGFSERFQIQKRFPGKPCSEATIGLDQCPFYTPQSKILLPAASSCLRGLRESKWRKWSEFYYRFPGIGNQCFCQTFFKESPDRPLNLSLLLQVCLLNRLAIVTLFKLVP